MKTRLAIFSDVHANLPALSVVAEHIRHGNYDGVYCLGDLGGYAAEPNEVQELVRTMECPTVLGNYDEGVGFERDDCGCNYIKPFDIEMSNLSFWWTREQTTASNKAWLRTLPRELRLEIDGNASCSVTARPVRLRNISFVNRSDAYLRIFAEGGKADAQADVIVFGHTHVPYHRSVDGVDFVNTGSVGRPKDGDARTGYCILTLDEGNVSVEQVRLPYDVETACARLIAAGLPAYFADYLRTGGNIKA